LDVQAKEINDEMKLAAVYAIAGLIEAEELHAEYVIPNAFDPRVAAYVAAAVANAAMETDVARKIVNTENVKERLLALVEVKEKHSSLV